MKMRPMRGDAPPDEAWSVPAQSAAPQTRLMYATERLAPCRPGACLGARVRAEAGGSLMSEDASCYECGEPLVSPQRDTCPACTRSQRRTCFCTAVIPRSEANCPQCGVDWADIDRLSRQRREEHRTFLRSQRIARWRNGLLLLAAVAACFAVAWTLGLGR